jgi:hypothetical protein
VRLYSVIPGCAQAPDPESRDSGFALRAPRNDRQGGRIAAAFSIGTVALKSGGGVPQVVAYVVAWALFAFQRVILWEIPSMPARFVWFRCAVSVPVHGRRHCHNHRQALIRRGQA